MYVWKFDEDKCIFREVPMAELNADPGGFYARTVSTDRARTGCAARSDNGERLSRGRERHRELFMWAGVLAEVLDGHPGVRIVLSTSWARELRFARARDHLPAGLRSRVIGATWHGAMSADAAELRPFGRGETWWDHATRYQQIRRYVDRARLDNWIAVDDDAEGWAVDERERLVETDPALGLGDLATLARLRAALHDRARWQQARQAEVKHL